MNDIPNNWSDLPTITARSASLLDGLGQCALAEHGRERINLLLPADDLVALVAAPDAASPECTPELLLALGRILALRARAAIARLWPDGLPAEPPAWAAAGRPLDLGVAGVVARSTDEGPGITQCSLGFGPERARVFLLRDGVMPTVWVSFSTAEPSDELLVATTRLLVLHRSACAERRVVP